jgi:chromosomal replication initiation ATPase DnaA
MAERAEVEAGLGTTFEHLRGLLTRKMALDQALQAEFADDLMSLRGFASAPWEIGGNKNPRLADITAAAAAAQGISVGALRERTRLAEVVLARQVYYYLAREYGYPLERIGQEIQKDHGCALLGWRRFRDWVAINDRVAIEVLSRARFHLARLAISPAPIPPVKSRKLKVES